MLRRESGRGIKLWYSLMVACTWALAAVRQSICYAFALTELGANFASNGAARSGGLKGIAQFDIQHGDFEHLVGKGLDNAAQADGGDGQQVSVVSQQTDDNDGPDQVL